MAEVQAFFGSQRSRGRRPGMGMRWGAATTLARLHLWFLKAESHGLQQDNK